MNITDIFFFLLAKLVFCPTVHSPSPSRSDRPLQRHRHPAGDTELAGSDLFHTQTQIRKVTMVTAGAAHVVPFDHGTIGDEGPLSRWQQDEVLLSRDHTVEILIVVFVH